VKEYTEKGRWFPAGSSMEEGDVNAPSAEAIIRQILYGNDWFRKELQGQRRIHAAGLLRIPASLPTILAHSGVKVSRRKTHMGFLGTRWRQAVA